MKPTEARERWKDVEGFFGYYKVSNLGRVWSAPRKGTKGGIICPRGNNKRNGLQVVFSTPEKSQQFYVHQLVALAFNPKPSLEHDCVMHANGDMRDNRARNLRWMKREDTGRVGVIVRTKKTLTELKKIRKF